MTAAPVVARFHHVRRWRRRTGIRTTSVTSRAVGIQTGNGNNQIVNGGSIIVDARDAQVAYRLHPRDCFAVAPAIGIQTGSGND